MCHAIRELMSYRSTPTTGGGVVPYRDLSPSEAAAAGVYRWAGTAWP